MYPNEEVPSLYSSPGWYWRWGFRHPLRSAREAYLWSRIEDGRGRLASAACLPYVWLDMGGLLPGGLYRDARSWGWSRTNALRHALGREPRYTVIDLTQDGGAR